jgi:peptide/nickel transport system ATP-binding protein
VSELALTVKNLRVSLTRGAQSIPLVDGISFALRAGEIVGLVGESGCGKSMTAAALMGLMPSPAIDFEADHILLGDTDLAALNESQLCEVRGRKISMIFQEPLTALDPVFTIGNQLSTLIRRHLAEKKKTALATALGLLESVQIADPARIMKSYPHQLSGGMRQRVMIAMAMACQPSVLIADEPTTALDVTTQAQVLAKLAELGRISGTAILLITHDLGVIAQSCDRALVMYCGRIVEEASVSELFTRPSHPYTAGLLAAIPRVNKAGLQRVRAIPGSVPQPGQSGIGCDFAARCDRADYPCQDQTPNLTLARTSAADIPHRQACHHPLTGKTGE